MALPRRLLTTTLSVALLVLASLSPTTADVINRPDLTVTKGSIGTAGDHAERLKGAFTVRNAGGLPAIASKSLVQAKVGKQWKYVTELRILPLAPKKSAAYAFNTKRPDVISLGSKYPIRVCLDVNDKIREAREGNNCRSLGTLNFELQEDELDYQPDTKFFHSFDGVKYYGWVPAGYDDTHATPSALFVWFHGCGGQNEFDIENFHAPSADDYITIAPANREGDCWKTPNDAPGDERLIAPLIDDAAEHFNIDPERIVLGGYSSGGDLSYRAGYLFSRQIDAVLVANSTPFRDTGFTQQQALDTAASTFRVVHLAHLGDDTYPIATVRAELAALQAADFPVTSIEREGGHYNEPGENGLPGTDADIKTYLLPQVDPGP